MASQNKFANPYNGIELGENVYCSCKPGADCFANFVYVYDDVLNTVTVTDKSYLAAGDGIVATTGINVTVQDAVVPTPGSAVAAGDDTAPIVVDVSLLDASATFRIDYEITTDNGCTSSASVFFTPSVAAQAEGSPDPYYSIR
jgi:hypothetical protein